MRKYEYFSVEVKNDDKIHDVANHFASEGWSVKQVINTTTTVGIYDSSNLSPITILFEREVSKLPSSEVSSRTTVVKWS